MQELPDFDTLWNYADPVATELKFRHILDTEPTLTDLSYHLQLLTQLARTYSLRRMFDESQNILDEVRSALGDEPSPEQVRYYLEQGRVYNSSGDKPRAREEFEKALTASETVGADFHTVDALHMLAIVSQPDEAIEWNKKAMLKAEASEDERAQGWLGSLYNNLGWSYFGKKDFATALDIFRKGLDWQLAKGREKQASIAKWSVARTLRAMGKTAEALQLQYELEKENKEADGYNYEEIGECLLELKRKEEAKSYFARAYETLKDDLYLKNSEPERLERLKKLS
ncbi:MAG: tetratricopeptide repeat protein [Bacteroidetes bacterium]|nr:tetratricopeptide repeat protein [Bacteroidota bacterium]